MKQCRNCGGDILQELGFLGKLEPFFLKRVFGMRLGLPLTVHPLKRLVRRVAAAPLVLLQRLNKPVALVELQLCSACSFVQTKLPFEEQAIHRLYADYRSDSYNRERSEYEPTYAAIAARVGQDAQEIESRVTAATRFLKDNIPSRDGFSILDYGGADGKFLPRLDGEKFVFEISNIEPIAGVTRVHTDAEMKTYSLVQLTHVIEHVVAPLELVKYVATKVEPGGYLYLETPQELTDAEREQLKSGRRTLSIHEHVNSYCVPAVAKLLESAGLRVVAMEATAIDAGWGQATHIRALGQAAPAHAEQPSA